MGLLVGTCRLAQRVRRLAHALRKLLTFELSCGLAGRGLFPGFALPVPRKAFHLLLQTLGALGEPLLIAGKPAPGIVSRLAFCGATGFVGEAALGIRQLTRLELEIAERSPAIVGARRLQLFFEIAQAL